jgi:acyl-coenzyme A thioesterase PaaI-like protein
MSDGAEGRGGFPSLREAITDRVVNRHVASGSRADLANATRVVIDEIMRSTAPDEYYEQAAVLVRQAADLLRAQAHDRGYEGVAEGSLMSASHHQSFIDYSPFIGSLNPLAPPIRVRFENDTVIGTCTYGAAYEGPPGCLHGGYIAAGFDEMLGFAQAFSGRPGMTGRLTVSYRSPTPLFREVTFTGKLDRVDGRKIYTTATLTDGDRLCAEAEGLFISLRPEAFQRLVELRGGANRPTTQ